MCTVCWADNSRLPWLVEHVELTRAHAHVEPIGHLDLVAHLAGGAEIESVATRVLHSLKNSYLAGRIVTVVHWHSSVWVDLLVGTYPALSHPGGHAGGDECLRGGQ